ncbi:MAG: hypothetical protein QXN15_06830 [Candidatus Jordarchaeales archaeon]
MKKRRIGGGEVEDLKTTFKSLIIILAAASLILASLSQLASLIQPVAFPVAPQTTHTLPQTNSKNSATLLYIYNSSGPNHLEDWLNVLVNENYTVSPVNYDDFLSSSCDVIVIDPVLNVNETLAQKISQAGKPVLALGLGGAQYLNHTGKTVVAHDYCCSNNEFHSLGCRVNALLHEILCGVNVSSVLLPLTNGDNCTFIDSSSSFILLNDTSFSNHGFLSVAGSVVHVALHNITYLYSERNGMGGECFRVVMNAVDWLARGAPRYGILVSLEKEVYGYENVTVNVSVYDNWKVNWCAEQGNVTLNVTRNGSTVYFNSCTGCNVSFTISVLDPGNYSVLAEREGCIGVASFMVKYWLIQLAGLAYRDGKLFVNVTVDGVPAEGVAVNFSYVKGFRIVTDFWSVRDEFTFIGSGVTNGSGWASVEFNLNEYVTVVAWVDTPEARNYTYRSFPPQLALPTPNFPSLSLIVLVAPSWSQLSSTDGLWRRAAGATFSVAGLVALFMFRRFRL